MHQWNLDESSPTNLRLFGRLPRSIGLRLEPKTFAQYRVDSSDEPLYEGLVRWMWRHQSWLVRVHSIPSLVVILRPSLAGKAEISWSELFLIVRPAASPFACANDVLVE